MAKRTEKEKRNLTFSFDTADGARWRRRWSAAAVPHQPNATGGTARPAGNVANGRTAATATGTEERDEKRREDEEERRREEKRQRGEERREGQEKDRGREKRREEGNRERGRRRRDYDVSSHLFPFSL